MALGLGFLMLLSLGWKNFGRWMQSDGAGSGQSWGQCWIGRWSQIQGRTHVRVFFLWASAGIFGPVSAGCWRACAQLFFFNDYLMSLMKLLLDNYEIFFPLRDALPLIEWNQREIQLEGYV